MTRSDIMAHCATDLLRASAGRPRVHGNGFIQIDLSERVRLHVWGHGAIPRQASETPVHDHTFGFTSYVLHGALENVRYQFRPDGSPTVAPEQFPVAVQPHRATVRHGEDTVLSPYGPAGVIVSFERLLHTAGSRYSMRAGEIHESVPRGPSLSVIVKNGPTLSQGGPAPTVFVPLGVEPDNAFDRYAEPEDKLWAIVELVLAEAFGARKDSEPVASHDYVTPQHCHECALVAWRKEWHRADAFEGEVLRRRRGSSV